MTAAVPRLVDQVVVHVQMLISERKLDTGMRLPAERQLAAELGCSRSILREAIQKLIGAGILASRQGGGTYLRYPITQWSEQRIVQVLKTLAEGDASYQWDILEARHTIEAGTAWYAAIRATPTDKEKLIACFDATLKFKDSDDPDLAAQADVRFHLAIAEASHNIVLLQTMRGFFDLLQSSVLHSRQRMYSVPVIFTELMEQHHELLQAILAGNADRARDAAQSHLGFVHRTMKKLQDDGSHQTDLTQATDEPIDKNKEGKA